MPLFIGGAAGNDSILGSIGDDSIAGGAGDDTLSGNIFGLDTLAGGAGADLFILNNSQLNDATRLATIYDWEAQDRISIADGTLPLTYKEATATDYAGASNLASLAIHRAEANFVVVQVGPDLFLFVDTRNDDGSFDDEYLIRNATLSDIDASNFLGLRAEQIPPTLPAAPAAGVGGAGISMHGNMDLIHPADLLSAVIVDADEFGLELADAATHVTVQGDGFTYVNDQLVGGTVMGMTFGFRLDTAAPMSLSVSGVSFPAPLLTSWVIADDAQGALSTMLAGNDGIGGRLTDNFNRTVPGDLIRGFAGNDVIAGQGGADTLYGGQGDDVIYALAPRFFSPPLPLSTYLRGEEGNDYIVGGTGFDDINGNQGNDTASGGEGDDWVVGGKDDDLLFGDGGDSVFAGSQIVLGGSDIVYGNLGNDTCAGGGGNDLIRGGQGDDLLYGEGGNDWISGDRGNDTMSGGLGADTFHTFSGAGIDRVVDFSVFEGDRVQVDAGTTWTVRQVGADTVIDMGNGDQMILVGVQMSTLTGNWIFTA